MNHLALFNGIGGFQIAAEWAGWNNVASIEIDEFCNKVTKYHFPECKQYEDIKEFDGTPWRGTIDVISGGFPCQPYSQAGKRLGKADDRHLWPEMLRVIREVAPRYVVGENVRGLISWNGGMVFDEVQADLETAGYEVLPFLLPACGVNAPHERYRIWFVAHRNDGNGKEIGLQTRGEINLDRIGGKRDATNSTNAGPESMQQQRENGIYGFEASAHTPLIGQEQSRTARPGRPGFENGDRRFDTNADYARFQATGAEQQAARAEQYGELGGLNTNPSGSGREELNAPGFAAKPGHSSRIPFEKWSDFPTQSPVCSRNDGISAELDGIAFSKWRNESIKAYGNAVVPELVYQIFRVINMMEKDNP